MNSTLFSDDIRKSLIDLSKKKDLKLLIVFGSRAKGNSKKNSDYDFAFLSNNDFSVDDYIKLHEDLMDILNYEKIDLINLNKSTKLHVNKNIFVEGELIYENEKGVFANERYKAWKDFLDFKKYYDMQAKITKNELREMANE